MQPSIGILLRELARLYTQAQREHVTSAHDTSSTQSHVIMELGRAGLLTQHELGRRLSLDKGWVSRAVESLVQADLVTKSRSDNDRRSRWLQLTSKGNARYQALNASLDTHAEQLLQPLAPEQRTSIHQALTLLLNGLQSALPQEAGAQPVTLAQPLAAEPAAADTPQKAEAPATVEAPSRPAEAVAELATAGAIEETALAQPVAREPVGRSTESVLPSPRQSVGHATATETRQHEPRVGQPDAPTRIVGSKTLPTKPLLSHQAARTPLSRAAQSAAHSAEQRTPPAPAASGKPTLSYPGRDTSPAAPRTISTAPPAQRVPQTPQHPVHIKPAGPAVPPAQPVQGSHTTHSAAHQPHATHATPASHAPHNATPTARPVVTVTKAPPVQPPVVEQRQGGLFQKILSQGSLFNKLLQREQPPVEVVEEAPAPVEPEPQDDILFQTASPSDWNEIRNLLTANRQTIQGALNHLSHFVVATENGRVIGCIGLEVYGDIGLVRSLVVASNMRGRAIGKRLIKQLVVHAQEKHLSALYMLSNNADPLFERHSFTRMARADMPTKLYVSTEMQGSNSSATSALRLIL
jgi:DNA-binding MarR family transcriptional regulator/N-acetylglutamate synthase-like GNAT family acetyltransferase